jgi:autotransporter-associated beta strand protein
LTLNGGGSINKLVVEGGAFQVPTGSFTVTSTSGASSPGNEVYAGMLTISGGANFNASGFGNGLTIIDGSAGTGITVTGAGTQYENGSIYVGNSDAGSFTVQLGASAVTDNYLIVGYANGSHGTLSVASGGSISCYNETVLGLYGGATGTASVDGAGSILNTGALLLGGANGGQLGGDGALTITNRGAVIAAFTEFFSNTGSITSNGGTLTTGSLASFGTGYGAIVLTDPTGGGAALTITGSLASATYSGSISGTGSLLKTGGGTQVLSGDNTFTGTVLVTGGLLEMGSGAATAYQASGGTLQLDFGNYGAATLEADAGSTIILNTPAVYGGVLLGSGSFNTSVVTRYQGTTISSGISITPAAGANLVGVTNFGAITDSSGNTLAWTDGTNLNGALTVNGATTLSNWTSTGIVQINPGGIITDTGANMVLGGGSQTYVGPANGSGGMVNLSGGATVQLNGGLLVNNGNISGGAVDVNFGGVATGNGSYSSVVVNAGGTYLPGLYGSGSPAANDSTTAAIEPAASGATSTSSPIMVSANTIITVNANSVLTLAGGLTANGQAITKESVGTLIVAPFTAASLNVSAGTVDLSPSSSVLSLSSLSVASGATLDLTSAAADITNTSLASISALVGHGYAGGAWTGAGINSSTAASDTRHLTALGVIQNNQSGTPLYSASNPFHGVTPGAADVLVAYTYYGDANLDGKVDATDYSRIDNGYLAHLTGWFNGDFNYDGAINGSDYTLIDNAFNMQGAQINAATSTSQIADPATAVSTPVPEPAVTPVALCAIAVIFRRRKCWR